MAGGETQPPARRRWRPGPRGLTAAAVALTLAATGGLLLAGGDSQPTTLTVYVSLPVRGSEGMRSAEMVRGMRLALRRARGRAGRFRMRLAPLDDSGGPRGWSARAVAANARRAAADERAAVYIGELDSAASAVSIPILSRAKIAQLSPASTAVGPTIHEPGAAAGEPAKHYADGFRNFARIVPRDSVQAQALMSLVRADRCSGVAILRSRDDGLATSFARAMRRHAMHRHAMHRHAMRPVLDAVVGTRLRASPARVAVARDADCVVFTAGPAGAAAWLRRMA